MGDKEEILEEFTEEAISAGVLQLENWLPDQLEQWEGLFLGMLQEKFLRK